MHTALSPRARSLHNSHSPMFRVILPLPTFLLIPARVRHLTPTIHPTPPICTDIPHYSGATFPRTHTIISKINPPSCPTTLMLPSMLSHIKLNSAPYRLPLRQNPVPRSTQRKARMVCSQDHPKASYLVPSMSRSLRTTQAFRSLTKETAQTPQSSLQQSSLLPSRLA